MIKLLINYSYYEKLLLNYKSCIKFFYYLFKNQVKYSQNKFHYFLKFFVKLYDIFKSTFYNPFRFKHIAHLLLEKKNFILIFNTSMKSWPEGWASETIRSDQLQRNSSTSSIRWLTRKMLRRHQERWSRNLLRRWRLLRQFSSKTRSSASSETKTLRSWVWKKFWLNKQCIFVYKCFLRIRL